VSRPYTSTFFWLEEMRWQAVGGIPPKSNRFQRARSKPAASWNNGAKRCGL